MPAMASPCALLTPSTHATLVRYIRVRTTCLISAPNSVNAASMISKQRFA